MWVSGGDGSGYGIFAQRFDSSGSALGSQFQVNAYTPSSQKYPAVAADADGELRRRLGCTVAGHVRPRNLRPTAATVLPPTATPTATPLVCPVTVDGGCTTGFGAGTLLVKEDVPGKEKLIVKMVKGPLLSQTALGNPLNSGGTVYLLCVYDNGGNLAAGIGSSIIVDRAGDNCGGLPCWKAIGGDPPGGKGYKYKDTALAADGVLKLLYKGGGLGQSKAIVKGKGPNLPDGIPAALQSASSATVQLRSTDGICLSMAVDEIKKQSATVFKAKFSVP